MCRWAERLVPDHRDDRREDEHEQAGRHVRAGRRQHDRQGQDRRGAGQQAEVERVARGHEQRVEREARQDEQRERGLEREVEHTERGPAQLGGADDEHVRARRALRSASCRDTCHQRNTSATRMTT
jgi:hypothetical protein